MLKRNRIQDDRASRVDRAPRARGGVSPGAILTGVVVAFGAIFLLSAVIGGVLASTGVVADNVSRDDVVTAGVAGGIAFLIAQLLAYLWGGYTAGRMGRGAGLANGILVPVVAILVAVVIGVIAAALGATAELNLPFNRARLPLEEGYAIELGTGIGIGILIAMFLGGALGGMMGARWHTKLERRAVEEVEGRHISEQPRSESSSSEDQRTPEQPRSESSSSEDQRTPEQPRR